MQPTANIKKAIERRSCSYGRLPPATGAVDTIYHLAIAPVPRTNHITINEDNYKLRSSVLPTQSHDNSRKTLYSFYSR